MRSLTLALASALVAASEATSSNTDTIISKRQSSCPSVWTSVATDLQSSFVSDGTCTDAARQAIRLSFHDCFPEACDGSVILADECTTRGENAQMVDICGTLGDKATSFNVSTADIIQFAAAIGIASCTGGPVISFYAGRTDSSTANPTGQIPGGNANSSTLVADFAAKGFSITELVALAGAHTIGKQLDGSAMDSTVGNWDSGFYSEVSDNSAPDPLDSDRFLSNSSDTSSQWSSVGASSSSFESAFVPAMEKMSLLGNDKNSLIDCSDVISSYASGSLTQKAVAGDSDRNSEAGTSTSGSATTSAAKSIAGKVQSSGNLIGLTLAIACNIFASSFL